jgi:anti-sigma B factor antagonist
MCPKLISECEDFARYESRHAWQDFELTVERGAEISKVRIAGELDIATVPELDRALEGLAGDGRHRLELDLDDLLFMDARGLRAIVRAKRFVDRHGGRLTILRSSGQVQRLFELTDMLDYLSFD